MIPTNFVGIIINQILRRHDFGKTQPLIGLKIKIETSTCGVGLVS